MADTHKLKKIVDSYKNCKIKFYPFICEFNIPESNYPPIGYATVLLADIIYVDKVVYIDGDTLILNSFKELMDLELGDNYAAGVLDPSPSISREKIGFSSVDNYYNAGVVLFDLKKIRENGMQKKLTKELEKPYRSHDQDIINLVLKNHILTISIKYNFFGHFLELKYEEVMEICSINENFYTKNEVECAKKDIVCTHFLNLFCDVPWRDKSNPMFIKFKEYVDKTPFSYNDIFVETNYPFWKRVMHKLLRNIPPILYRNVAKIYFKRLYEEN